MVGLAWEPWQSVSHLKVFPLGASSPTLPGAVNSLESPWPEAARRKAANTVAKGKQMDRECAPSLSAQFGGKAQATSKAWHLLFREGPFHEIP